MIGRLAKEVTKLNNLVKNNVNTKNEIKEVALSLKLQTERLNSKKIRNLMEKWTETEKEIKGKIAIRCQTDCTDKLEEGIIGKIGQIKNDKTYVELIETDWPTTTYRKTKIKYGNPLLPENIEDIIIMIDNSSGIDRGLKKSLVQEHPPLMGKISQGKLEGGKIIQITNRIEDGDDTEEKILWVAEIPNKEKDEMSRSEYVLRLKNIVGKIGSKVESKSKEKIGIGIEGVTNETIIRKILEDLLRNTNLEASIYRKRERKSITGQEESEIERNSDRWYNEMIEIRTEEEEGNETYANAVKNMKNKINIKNYYLKIARQETTKRGFLKLKITSRDQRNIEKLKQDMKKELDGKAKVQEIVKKKQLTVRDITREINEEDIKEAIGKNNENVNQKEQEIKVEIMAKENKNGMRYAYIETSEEMGIRLLNERRIEIKWNRCRILEKISPSRCNNCVKIGHRMNECGEKVGAERKCLRCNRPGHTAKECRETPFCVSCGEEGHRTDSMDICLMSESKKGKMGDEWIRNREGAVAIKICNGRIKASKAIEGERGFVGVEVKGVTIYSCYFSPNKKTTEFEKYLEELKRKLKQNRKNAIVAGDFNAKNIIWNASKTEERGKIMEEFMAEMDMIVCNRGDKPTFETTTASSIIDITMASNNGKWKVRDWTVGEEENLSDHNNVYYILERETLNTETKKKLKTEKIRWRINEKSKHKFQEKLRMVFDKNIDEARKKCIRAKRASCRTNERREETEENRNRKRKIYKEQKRELKKMIRKSKNNEWKKLCQEINENPWGQGYKIALKKIKKFENLEMNIEEENEVIEELFPKREEENWAIGRSDGTVIEELKLLINAMFLEGRNLMALIRANRNTKREIKQSARKIQGFTDKLYEGEQIFLKQAANIGVPKKSVSIASIGTQTIGTANPQSREISVQTGEESAVEQLPSEHSYQAWKQCESRTWSNTVFATTSVVIGNPLEDNLPEETKVVFVEQDDREMTESIQSQFKSRHPELAELDDFDVLEQVVKIKSKKADKSSGQRIIKVNVPIKERDIFEKMAKLKGEFGYEKMLALHHDLHDPLEDVRGKNALSIQTKNFVTYAIVVNKQKESAAETIRKINTSLGGNNSRDKIKTIKTNGEGNLVITLDKDDTALEKIGRDIEKSLGKESVRLLKERKEKASIFIRGMDAAVSKQEVFKGLKSVVPELKETDVAIGKMRPYAKSEEAVTVRLPEEHAEKILRSRLRVGLVRCKLERHLKIERCTRCWAYDHVTSSCNGPDRRKCCFRCGKPDHWGKNCPKKEEDCTCVLCKVKGHWPRSSKCSKFREALNGARAAKRTKQQRRDFLKRRETAVDNDTTITEDR
ncbi:myosin-2 heavy chain-like [Euwallacea similis]|uniref:myosin-2 heavy chain-like n=1 Tax=Euwallacea similis TaxID=1736056 RepID=UPI00344C760C